MLFYILIICSFYCLIVFHCMNHNRYLTNNRYLKLCFKNIIRGRVDNRDTTVFPLSMFTSEVKIEIGRWLGMVETFVIIQYLFSLLSQYTVPEFWLGTELSKIKFTFPSQPSVQLSVAMWLSCDQYDVNRKGVWKFQEVSLKEGGFPLPPLPPSCRLECSHNVWSSSSHFGSEGTLRMEATHGRAIM